MTRKRAGTKAATPAGRDAPAPAPHAPPSPKALTPVTTPPALGASRLEVIASPFRVLRVTLRHLEYQEVEQRSGAVPADAVGTDTHLAASVTLFVEGVEVALDVHVPPEPTRMPVRLRVAFSAFLARPEGMSDEQFVPLIGEIGPRLLLPYVRQAVTQVTALGLYGPLNLDLLNLRVVWEHASREP